MVLVGVGGGEVDVADADAAGGEPTEGVGAVRCGGGGDGAVGVDGDDEHVGEVVARAGFGDGARRGAGRGVPENPAAWPPVGSST